MNAQERYAKVAARYGLKNPSRKNVTGMPLGEGFTPYKQRPQTGPELVAGLESLFGGEGPESLGSYINIPGLGLDAYGRNTALESLDEGLDFKSPIAKQKYLEKFKTTPFFLDLIKVRGLGTSIKKISLRTKQPK